MQNKQLFLQQRLVIDTAFFAQPVSAHRLERSDSLDRTRAVPCSGCRIDTTIPALSAFY